MKRIMTRSLVLWLLTFVFMGGIVYLVVQTVMHHNEWAQKPYNGHMGQIGDIFDRDEEAVLHTDENGAHSFSEDALTREALMHVIGEDSLSISTSILNRYGAKIANFNFFWGAGQPESMRPDNNVSLTVDADACKAAYEALGGHKGACVVYNYKTGEVLCDTSAPSYDPEDPPTITEENESEYEGVYLDNVVSSSFTPGSVFKIVTAAAAIENIPDIDSKMFTCTGSVEIDGNRITCEYMHGFQTFSGAFANSCNCAFANIAIEVGEEKLKETAEKLGFNKDDFKLSDIPVKMSHYDATDMGDVSLAWSGIGQQEDLANPLLMARICAAVANNGTSVSPYLVVDDGNLLNKLGISDNKGKDVEMMSADTAEKVKKLMTASATRYRTLHGVSLAGLNFCAKTGTAEVGEGREPTAWFVGFIDDPDYPYAFAAVVVEGGYGINAASPVVDAAIGALVD